MAQHEPYFPVLRADGGFATEGGAQSSAEFFATGEADVSMLLAAINGLLSRDVSLDSVLDFGCGAGRLSLPLATRARHVTGCDIAPTMLTHARNNARSAGATNVEFLLNQELLARSNASFSFICSLSVFQYIAPSDGYALLRSLARLLVPGGVAAIQLQFGGGNSVRRFAHARGVPRARPFGVNVYNEKHVVAGLMTAGVEAVARLPLNHDHVHDAVLIARRP